MIQTGNTLGTALCRVLGLDADLVTSIDVQCRSNEIATARVEMAIRSRTSVEHVFINYRLEPASFADWLNMRVAEEKHAIHAHYNRLRARRFR